MIVDDTAVRIGSSNLANRSMGLDSECDLLIEARGRDDLRAAIRDLRDGLIAEHLLIPVADVRKEIERSGSLSGAVERFRSSRQGGLRPLDVVPEPWLDVIPDGMPFDPAEPIEVRNLLEQALGDDAEFPRIVLPVAGGLALFGLFVGVPALRRARRGQGEHGDYIEHDHRVLGTGRLGQAAAAATVAVLLGLAARSLTAGRVERITNGNDHERDRSDEEGAQREATA
jgi:hypothetical protein